MNSTFDKWLARSNSFAQIAVATVAIFGYFYTVIPVYQRELLSEEIAQKQVYINKLENIVKLKDNEFNKYLRNIKEIKTKNIDLQNQTKQLISINSDPYTTRKFIASNYQQTK